ncbi:hypothetical protein ACJX0J_006813, partial [Zea mays]
FQCHINEDIILPIFIHAFLKYRLTTGSCLWLFRPQLSNLKHQNLFSLHFHGSPDILFFFITLAIGSGTIFLDKMQCDAEYKKEKKREKRAPTLLEKEVEGKEGRGVRRGQEKNEGQQIRSVWANAIKLTIIMLHNESSMQA